MATASILDGQDAPNAHNDVQRTSQSQGPVSGCVWDCVGVSVLLRRTYRVLIGTADTCRFTASSLAGWLRRRSSGKTKMAPKRCVVYGGLDEDHLTRTILSTNHAHQVTAYSLSALIVTVQVSRSG